MVAPYALITVIADPTDPIIASAAVDATNSLIAHLMESTKTTAASYCGPSWVNGSPYNISESLDLLYGGSQDSDVGRLSRLRNLMWRHISYTAEPFHLPGFYTEVDTPFDPQSESHCRHHVLL